MKKLYFLFFALLMTTASFGQIIITELADPNNLSAARFVEIYNISTTGVDLTDWELRRWTNGNTDPQTTGINLSSIGILSPGSFAIIAADGNIFQSTYGFAPDIIGGTGGAADSNGDDQIAIFNSLDETIDIFGVPGEDGSGTCHEFEDGRAERKSTVTVSSNTWDESEWNVWADSAVTGCTSHVLGAQDAPGIFDPGSWIGATPSTDPTLFIVDGPPNGSTNTGTPEDGGDVNIYFGTTNFTVASPPANDGYIEWEIRTSGNVLVGGGDEFDISTPILINLPPGDTYSVNAELVDPSGVSLSPAVIYAITFTIPAYIEVANLAELRAGSIGDDLYYKVTGEVIGTFMQSYRNQRYIQDATAGILVDDPDLNEPTTYSIGDGVVNIRGQLSTFNGVLQFTPMAEGDDVPVNSSGNIITPEVVTLAELASNWENYESELVEIKAATFTESGNFATGTDYTINDGTGDLTFRTNFFDADYIGMPIPSTPQNLVVIVGEFNGTPQVTSRFTSDVTLRVNSDAIKGFNLYPNPVTNGRLFINTLSNSEKKIQIFDVLGKKVLSTNLKGREINVSKLQSGVYIIKIIEEGKTATRKLVIK
jgi:hypothetical protein